MEYMPGQRLADCFEHLTYRQKLRTAADVANIMSSMFKMTAPQCGSVSPYTTGSFQGDPSVDTLRYPPLTPLHSPRPSAIIDGQFCVGPVNDLVFLEYPRQIDPGLCGPFGSERDFMEAVALLGKPPTRTGGRASCRIFEKTLEVYDIVRRLYRGSEDTSTECRTFHFAHGDLSDDNILIDPSTGAVTGVIDWEMAGFRPPWLAAVGADWFDDDSERFIMTDFQSCRGNHADDTPADAVVSAHFRLRLAALDERIFRHHLQGIELRALFYACCNEFGSNTETWLEKYRDQEWSLERRGDFPIDLMACFLERLDLEDR